MKENPTTNQPFPRRSRTAARSELARGSPCCEPRGIPAAGAAPQAAIGVLWCGHCRPPLVILGNLFHLMLR